MKYIYIICLVLSSFFTYKTLSAQTSPIRYAFFIPAGAYDTNTDTPDIKNMRSRYNSTNKNHTRNSNYTKQKQSKYKKNTSTKTSSTIVNKKILPRERINISKVTEITSPDIKTVPNTTSDNVTKNSVTKTTNTTQKNTQPPKQLSSETIAKIKKYTLDKNPNKVATTTQETEVLQLEKIKQQTVTELLENIPYPDSTHPKFKQIYPLYGLELRSFHRRGHFPSNQEQEQTLAKANSLKRFNVQ